MWTSRVIGYYSPFPVAIPGPGAGCLRVTHPSAALHPTSWLLSENVSLKKEFPARLACVRHAASVHPEPGSNSLLNGLSFPHGPIEAARINSWFELRSLIILLELWKTCRISVCLPCIVLYNLDPALWLPDPCAFEFSRNTRAFARFAHFCAFAVLKTGRKSSAR